jgi:hypothetical protein
MDTLESWEDKKRFCHQRLAGEHAQAAVHLIDDFIGPASL